MTNMQVGPDRPILNLDGTQFPTGSLMDGTVEENRHEPSSHTRAGPKPHSTAALGNNVG
jgi:hypothetical protein